MSSADITPREIVTLLRSDVAPKAGEDLNPRHGHNWSYTLTVQRPVIPPGGDATPVTVGAVAVVEVHNDGVGWILYGTLTAPDSDDLAVDPIGISGDRAYGSHRARLISLTGPAGTVAFVTGMREGD